MVSQNQSPAAEAARTIASELGQPTRGKGVDRLAAALVDAVTSDLCELDAAARLEKLPGTTWVYVSAYVGYTPGSKYAVKAVKYSAAISGLCSIEQESMTGFLDAVEKVEKKYADEAKTAAREKTIRERVEREMAEADAAEAALKNTVDAEKGPEYIRDAKVAGLGHDDGSPSMLPEPFDGVTPADGGGR